MNNNKKILILYGYGDNEPIHFVFFGQIIELIPENITFNKNNSIEIEAFIQDFYEIELRNKKKLSLCLDYDKVSYSDIESFIYYETIQGFSTDIMIIIDELKINIINIENKKAFVKICLLNEFTKKLIKVNNYQTTINDNQLSSLIYELPNLNDEYEIHNIILNGIKEISNNSFILK